ncbi:hypothetical protein FH972_026470 [Carpinus fangiana]|uniref:Uncharacterized protein n=1 Tax=Carpinus fangiana TaxID=176857 RepID=A0A5N6L446_9ROSI|nr:hypothetical protein FH972_026470 [Carpinus fangiana]
MSSPPAMLSHANRRKRPSRMLLVLGTVLVLCILTLIPSSNPASVDRIWKNVNPSRARECMPFPKPNQQPLVGNAKTPMLRDVTKPAGTVVAAPHRALDVQDSFAKYRRTDKCFLSSLELHEPFEPLCPDRKSVLRAMSDGGRAGQNAPYVPRGCDMRWYTTEEVCEIMSRFSYVWTVGDSLMRHVTSAIHLLMREDLIEGGYTKWRPNSSQDCTCRGASENGACFANEAWSSREIWDEDPKSMHCPKESTARLEYTVHNKYPLDDDNLNGYRLIMPKAAPPKPMAFIFGHGLWNDLKIEDTRGWFEQIDKLIRKEMPWVTAEGGSYPKLFMTPNAGGVNKPANFQDAQGNYAVMRFEWAVESIAAEYDFEVAGTVNMTVQSDSPDGTHAGRRADLIKAQMILNWLDRLEGRQHPCWAEANSKNRRAHLATIGDGGSITAAFLDMQVMQST